MCNVKNINFFEKIEKEKLERHLVMFINKNLNFDIAYFFN